MATNRKDMPQHYFTLEEYFALEEASEARWEYWDGELVCMSGGSRKHIIISSNVFFDCSCNSAMGRAERLLPTCR